jgi:two-component system nitrogen regulation sensor histidine kinase GlnL
MRRSSLLLLIIVEVLALFIFENMRSLFTSLEKKELQAVIATSDLQAELHVLRTLQGQSRPGRGKYFDRVLPLQRGAAGQRVIASGKEQVLEIRKPLGEKSGLLFQKTIRSAQLDSFQGLKKVLSLLVLLLGLAIAASGIYFMILLRKKVPEPAVSAGSPFQDYLVEMKNSQQELQDLVVTQRRTASEQEELNKSIINTVHLGVIYLSSGGKIEIFNPAAQALFGRSFVAARNHLLADALPGHPELVRFILAGDKRKSADIESGRFIFFVDVVPVGPVSDGGPPVPSDRDVGAQSAPPAPGEGRVDARRDGRQGRLVLVRDVSEERKKERIRRHNDNLMMLGEMAASLAHEVRNSLGVILGYSKAMSGEADKTAKIIREVQFMSEMMESFLRFAKPVPRAGRKPTDLGAVIAAAAAAQEIAVKMPAPALELNSDPLLLNVIFTNLALNARQAGARNLTVEFTPGSAPAVSPRIDAAVTIGDDGPGIAASSAEKIWLPFFSTRDKGTGMGLATVKKLVSALGADIQLLNPGEPGAQFKITFYS